MSAEIETLHVPYAAFLKQRGIEFIRARSDRESTIEKGWCDFTLLHPRQASIMVEFKDKDGKESKDQVRVRERLTAKGFRCFVCRDLGIAMELTNAWYSGAGEPQEAPCAPRGRLTVRNRAGHGSWLWDGKAWLRKATIDDLGQYPSDL